MSASIPNVYFRMALVLADFPAVAKSQSGEGISYSYRGIDDALKALHPLLAKHGLFMTASWKLPTWSEWGKTRAGALQHHVEVRGKLHFWGLNGDRVSVALLGEGIDTRDKALMKAQANAMKYAVWYTFCVPTEEKKDSEAYDGDTDEVYEKPAGPYIKKEHVVLRMVQCRKPEQYKPLADELNALAGEERKLAHRFRVLHKVCMEGKQECECEKLAKEALG